jgi:hypothetical protein
MNGRNVARPALDAHGFAGEEQVISDGHAKRFPSIRDGIIRECRVAATAVRIVVPQAPLGTHEEITDPLDAEHVDKLVKDRLGRVGMVAETVGSIATHKTFDDRERRCSARPASSSIK